MQESWAELSQQRCLMLLPRLELWSEAGEVVVGWPQPMPRLLGWMMSMSGPMGLAPTQGLGDTGLPNPGWSWWSFGFLRVLMVPEQMGMGPGTLLLALRV